MAKLDDEILDRTWRDYWETGSIEARNRLMLHYTSLVRFAAMKVKSGLPAMVELEDLISYGQFGLLEAIEEFDPKRGFKFETFAPFRIKGSIRDEMRKISWVPRTVVTKMRDVEVKRNELQVELGRDATREELADALGISLEQLHKAEHQAYVAKQDSLDEGDSAEGGHPSISETTFDIAGNPEDLFASTTEIIGMVADAINTMPERHRIILSLYYLQEMTLAEIGEVLGVTESRVCQLQSKVLKHLGDALNQGALTAA